MYVCKYDEKTPLFSELCNLKWQYSGCSMVCINKCFAPWKSKKKMTKTNTHAVSALLDPALLFGLYRTLLHPDREPMNAALCVRAHTVCPEYHCWVLVHVCVRAVGVGGLTGSFAGPGTFGLCPHVQVWTMSTKGEFRDKRRRRRAPFLWLLLYIPIFWMCKPVHVVWKFLY